MQNYFQSPFRGMTLAEQVTNPNIVVGKFSYYSGYYHGHSFDECARYLLSDEGVERSDGGAALLPQQLAGAAVRADGCETGVRHT